MKQTQLYRCAIANAAAMEIARTHEMKTERLVREFQLAINLEFKLVFGRDFVFFWNNVLE